MSMILSYLEGLRLTLVQYALIMVAALIGYLVLKLKIQGGELHKAQVQLLAQNMNVVVDKDDDAVAEAQRLYQAALKAYRNGK